MTSICEQKPISSVKALRKLESAYGNKIRELGKAEIKIKKLENEVKQLKFQMEALKKGE